MTSQEFEDKYLRIAPRLYEIAFHLLQNPQDAEDVVQEVMVKLWREADRIYHLENPQGYILRVLRNECIDLLRERRNDTEVETYENALADEGEPPEIDASQRVHTILKSLPHREHRIITMRHVAECSIDDICEATGETPSNVRQILSRTRRKIVEQFKLRLKG